MPLMTLPARQFLAESHGFAVRTATTAATPPEHRRRGIARAGLNHALAARFQEGCHTRS